jgi:hypothetical protein
MMAALITGTAPPVNGAPFRLDRFAAVAQGKELTAICRQGSTSFVASYLR